MPFNQTFVLYYSDGNGFKTSTMRLGADVIVFSRCRGKDGNRFFHNNSFRSLTWLFDVPI